MVFFNCIINTPTTDISHKSQALVAKIYVKLFQLYCNEVSDGNFNKGWATEFRNRYAYKLYESVYKLVEGRVGNE